MNPPISHSRLETLLAILRRRSYPTLPKCAKTFLYTTSENYNIKVFDNIRKFVYFGIEKTIKIQLNPTIHELDNIELIFNVDGLPLFKSSKKQLWPILCKIHHDPNIYKPFPVAVYCGDEKPQSVQRYFDEFIEELNSLMQTGIIIDNRKFIVSVKAFICDTPARSFLKCIVGHGVYWACERCLIKGQQYMNRRIYPTCGELRTNKSFRNQSTPGHH